MNHRTDTDTGSSSETNASNASTSSAGKKIFTAILKYPGAYLLGIFLCVLLTPVESVLAGKVLWPLYPVGALFGFFLYYFYLDATYTTGSEMTYWLFGSIGLVPVLAEVIFRGKRNPALRVWRPLWIGTPIGFLGTMGAYYTAAASI